MYVSWSWWSLFNALLVPYISGWLSKNEILNFKLSNHISHFTKCDWSIWSSISSSSSWLCLSASPLVETLDAVDNCARLCLMHPPYINSCLSRDEFSLAFLIFATRLLPCIIVNTNQRAKTQNVPHIVHIYSVGAVLAATIGVRYRYRLGEGQMSL